MPGSLEELSKRERATFCNDYWQKEQHRVSPTAPTALMLCNWHLMCALLSAFAQQPKVPVAQWPKVSNARSACSG